MPSTDNRRRSEPNTSTAPSSLAFFTLAISSLLSSDLSLNLEIKKVHCGLSGIVRCEFGIWDWAVPIVHHKQRSTYRSMPECHVLKKSSVQQPRSESIIQLFRTVDTLFSTPWRSPITAQLPCIILIAATIGRKIRPVISSASKDISK